MARTCFKNDTSASRGKIGFGLESVGERFHVRIFIAVSLLFVLFAVAVQSRAESLLIRGGTVVNAAASERSDIRIRGERIVELGRLQARPGERVIDAAGMLVLPGGIDAHVHLVDKVAQDTFVDDFTSGTRAALAGGITTVGGMLFPQAGELPMQTLNRLSPSIAAQTLADVFVHTTVLEPSSEARAQVVELVEAGQPSIKVFMPLPQFEAGLDEYMQLLSAAADAGAVVAIHCEDLATVNYVAAELRARGHTTLAHYADSRPVLAERVATQRAVAMAEATGATIYVVHLSAEQALAAAASSGANVFVETRPLYLHLTDDVYRREDRGLYVGMPPIRSAADQAAMWQGLADGSIDTVATDHAPYTREQKLDPRQTIERFRAGVNNLQVMLPMLFSEGVNTGRLSVERFVEVTAANPAKIFGLYPRKGVIQVDADADVVVWDPADNRVVEDAHTLSNAGFSVYAGTAVTGWPRLTIRRGQVVYENGRVTAEPGSGRLLRREAFEPVQ